MAFFTVYTVQCYAVGKVCVSLKVCTKKKILIYFIPQQPYSVLGRPTVKVSISHTDTPHFVGVLWTSDPPDAETST
jgi:hypothetical protein